MDNAAQLARTIQLFQADLGVEDAGTVLFALTTPNILLVADEATVGTRSGQTAITTAALLMAKSGHRVYIDAPDAPLNGDHPPMWGTTLYEAISSVAHQIIDGVEIAIGCPLFEPHIAFVCGDAFMARSVKARRVMMVGWTDWAGEVANWPAPTVRRPTDWPVGAMAAATLMSAEAIKISGRILISSSSREGHYAELFADAPSARLDLAPEGTPKVSRLGKLDIISAGAVSNGFLYALLRLPDVTGSARVFDRDCSDETNRNRNMLLIGELVELAKVDLFKHFESGLQIEPIKRHFVESDLASLADTVAVGVDDIPTRWLLAKAGSAWMGVGATTHFNSMASVHYPYSGCAACLHPHDELQQGPVPTIAFVSFLAGLMMAADLLRSVAGTDISLKSRQRFLSPLQVGGDYLAGVPPRADCPAGCPASRIRSRG